MTADAERGPVRFWFRKSAFCNNQSYNLNSCWARTDSALRHKPETFYYISPSNVSTMSCELKKKIINLKINLFIKPFFIIQAVNSGKLLTYMKISTI